MQHASAVTHREQELLQLFGKDGWRSGQRELVQWALQGQACLGVLPTGHGKSLCFQIAALMMSGCSVVISPLIALMQDQVCGLEGLGIAAARFDSSLKDWERDELLQELRAGHIQILYLAPESMDNPVLLDALRSIELGLFVVDEAHCVSAWGHSFRPDYLKLPAWAARLPFQSLMALTATATPRVVADLQASFAITPQHCVILPPYRSNIERHLRISSDKLADLKEFLAQPQHRPAIIYARSRKNVEELAAQLSSEDMTVPCYHAGQNADTRAATQELFLNGDIPLLVATIAFGMGIDKADVRSVVHYHAPSSPEAYVQESGRAGRDGAPAHSLLLLDEADAIEIRNRIWAEEPDEEGILRCVRWLLPQSTRVVSNWELGTECDLAPDVPLRILDALQGKVKIIAKGYKFYKVKPLYPIVSICEGREEEEVRRLCWLDQNRDAEVEEAAYAWQCSYAEAMEQLQACEESQEWSLSFRQQAMQIKRLADADSRELAQQMMDYYQQRREGGLERWEQFRAMLASPCCFNEQLNAYFMGQSSGQNCGHCGPCIGDAPAIIHYTAGEAELSHPPTSEMPELARDGQRKRFLLGMSSPAMMRRRLWSHAHYGCLPNARWEDL